ncbi:hypothetical protein [Pseudactinotalea sp. Z1748]|uniref:hypothetical protein n=1 Tax=Pseudactinotalea sp. Z1748 TaxID=3413027 RepID=UPI003C7A7093
MSRLTNQPRPTFTADQFTFLRGGSGADKLATSAVAPLVAAARGYATVKPDEVRQAASAYRIGSMTSAAGQKLKLNVGQGDAMLMPWHRLDETLAAGVSGRIAKHTSLQLRPSEPLPPVRAGGSSRKYDMFAGTQTELDLHPATPSDWNQSGSTIFFTEGLIKGDAALTAMLRASGISDADLAKTHGGGDPAGELRKLMAKVPKDQRMLIISFVGVGNWRNRHEWAALTLRDKSAWVAFDADAGANLMVWRQAQQLMEYLEGRKMTGVHLVNLGLVSDEAARRKVGVDDYLGELGRWEDLPGALTDLPTRPRGKDEGNVGDWRVTPDGMGTQEAKATAQDDGSPGAPRWEDQVPIGGRVSRVEHLRQPTATEMQTGLISPTVDDPNAHVELELKWQDSLDGTHHTGRVTGPAPILGYAPKDWDRKGAHMPTGLLRHPEWPPEKGLQWLKAIKAHRRTDTVESVRWKSMGYVPTSASDGKSLPVYIAGNTVVTEEGVVTDSSIIGVDDEVLSGASNFGVMGPPEGVDWREQALLDLRAVLDAYIDSGAWTDIRMAATVLGIALRPAVPLRPSTVAYFVGARRSGKSFTASQCMSFWQPRPGTWGDGRLPGSAKDTIASMEHSVAHSNIWVSDDLAPSTDRNQASREEAAMGDLIRSIHNGQGKRRMNADMTSREVNNPRALLIVTAENEPSVSSVGDRMVVLNFGDGVLAPDRRVTDHLVRMREVTGEPARLAGALIRWHLWKATQLEGGWSELVEEVETELQGCTHLAAQELAGEGKDGDASRHAGMAADVMLSLAQLGRMAEDLGADEGTVGRLELLGLPAEVIQQVARAHDTQKGTSPGRRAVQAATLLLQSRQAHVISLVDPTQPPVKDRPDADLANSHLGWSKSGNEWRPQGPTIGWVVKGRDRATEVVLLDPESAFTQAQARYSHLLPAGQKQTTAWASAWDENLTVPQLNPEGRKLGWARVSNGRTTQSVVRVHAGSQRVDGVPFLLDTILSGVRDESDATGDGDEADDAPEPTKKKGKGRGSHLRPVA